MSAGDTRPNYDLKCRNWFWQQRSYWWQVVWGWMYTKVCPCDQRRVITDRRWRFDMKEYIYSNGERMCYYERRPYWISTQVGNFLFTSLLVSPFLSLSYLLPLSLLLTLLPLRLTLSLPLSLSPSISPSFPLPPISLSPSIRPFSLTAFLLFSHDL